MELIWPERADLTDEDLIELYRYPAGDRWVVANFVSSADGAVEHGGTAAALSTPADQRILHLGSDLADLLLVGAGTADIEQFHGMQPDPERVEFRRRHRLSDVATTAVVTTGRLPADATVITDAKTPTIVVTHDAVDSATRDAWHDAGAQVLIAGETSVDLVAAVDQLVDNGFRRIDCEGGPLLFTSLLAAGVVDELRLTISPLLVGGSAERITRGVDIDPADLRLASVVQADGALLIRYLLPRSRS